MYIYAHTFFNKAYVNVHKQCINPVYHPLQTIRKNTQFVMRDSCVLPFLSSNLYRGRHEVMNQCINAHMESTEEGVDHKKLNQNNNQPIYNMKWYVINNNKKLKINKNKIK